jgi:hypothetical protein
MGSCLVNGGVISNGGGRARGKECASPEVDRFGASGDGCGGWAGGGSNGRPNGHSVGGTLDESSASGRATSIEKLSEDLSLTWIDATGRGRCANCGPRCTSGASLVRDNAAALAPNGDARCRLVSGRVDRPS